MSELGEAVRKYRKDEIMERPYPPQKINNTVAVISSKYLPADAELKTADDPHHGSINEWGFDGKELWHRYKAGHPQRWNKVRRVSFTIKRIAVIANLIALSED